MQVIILIAHQHINSIDLFMLYVAVSGLLHVSCTRCELAIEQFYYLCQLKKILLE